MFLGLPFPGRAAGQEEGVVPLIKAVADSDYVGMQQQLTLGVDVNATDAQGRTALSSALQSKSVPAINWLLGKGADPDQPNAQGKTPLELAFQTGDITLFKPLLWARAPRRWSPVTLALLNQALQARSKPMVSTLLLAHNGPPVPEGSRQPLAAWLLARGDHAAFALLLDGGANPDQTLPHPVEKGLLSLIKDERARAFVEQESGVTLLLLAVAAGRLECLEALMAHNARTDLSTQPGHKTALELATALKAPPEIFQVLLGKNPEAQNRKVRLEISVKTQQLTIYKNDAPERVVPVSTGKHGYETPLGRFVVTDKDQMRMSTIYTWACMPFFMRLSGSEYGIHAGVVPDHPDSHGCIRVPLEQAQGLFDEVDLGTLVTIEK